MRRILIFIAFFVSIVSLMSCSGGSSSSSGPGGVNPGFPSDIQLLPTQYIVQTNSDSFFKARVLDGNGSPLPGVAVTFTNISPVGTINASKAVRIGGIGKSSGTTVAKTDSRGFATARVFSSTDGFVTVQSEVNAGTGKVRDKKTVYFSTFDFVIPLPPTPPPPPPPTLKLAVDGEDDGEIYDETEDFNLFETPDDDEVHVLATVLKGNGDPASGVVVTFGSDSTEVSFPDGSSTRAGADGKAQVRVKVAPQDLSDLITNINITAIATVDGDSAANMVTLFLQPIVVSNVKLSATPTVVAPSATSTISAYVTTSAGRAAPDGTAVSFTTTCGFIVPFGQTTGGAATAVFTAPTSFGTCTITGTTAGVNGSVNVIVSNALFITPASQTIPNPALSNTATYNITGGTGPYTATSSNPAVATVGVAGSTLTATVASVPSTDTTVTITVYDSVNASVTANLVLDLPPLLPLSVIPAAQAISSPVIGNTATYSILGGTGPYTAYSGSPGLATVGVAGSTLTATVAGVPASDATVTITIYDSTGESVSATLLLDMAPVRSLAVIPAAQAIANPVIGNTATYSILGGTGPYTAYSGSPGLATVGVAGSTLTATVAGVPAADATVTITIYDSVGTSVTATLLLDMSPVRSLAVIPASQAISNPVIGNSATYSILGGTGPYTAFSGNPGMVTAVVAGSAMTATVAGVPAVDTTVTITIYDSVGASVTANLILDVAPVMSLAVIPAAQTIPAPAIGNTATYSILGGTGPYTAYSVNPALAAVSVAGSVLTATVTGVPASDTTITITIYDSTGASVTATLLLDMAPIRSLTVIPAAQAIAAPAIGNTRTYSVTGGTGPYTAYSGNPGLVTVGVAGSTLTATVAGVPSEDTTVTITIYDSAGVSVTATLLLDMSPVRSLAVIPAAQAIANPAVGNSRTYSILGGTGPYTAYSGSPGLVTVGVAGSTLTATVAGVPASDTTVTMTIYDSAGVSVTATLILDLSPIMPLTVIPATQTISAPAVGNTRTYSILGGTGPYTAFSSNPGAATVGVAGSALTATVAGVPSSNTTVTITVYDNVGASVTATLILDLAPLGGLVVIPSTQTISNPAVGNTATYTILGGTGPYSGYSSKPGLVMIGTAGSTLTATVAGVPSTDTTVTITIFDSLGLSVTATLILDVAPTVPLAVIPAAQAISSPSVGNTAAYNIIGGTGPYTAYSGNPGLATVGVAGSTLTATVAGVPSVDTTVTITIYDSTGASVTATLSLDVAPIMPLTVIPAAQSIAAPVVGNTAAYGILGGTGPYTAYSASPGLATVGVAGSVLTATVAGVPAADATVTITIYDSVGASVTATLLLDMSPVRNLAVIPAVQVISSPVIGNSRTYSILGGTAPYSVYSGNPGLVTAGVAGPVLTATVAGVPSTDTTVTITIYDSAGVSVTANLVLDVAPVMNLTVIPAAQSIAAPVVGNTATYSILGGTGPYSAFSSKPGVATAGVAGSTLTATVAGVPSADTTVTFTIYDSTGASVTATLLLDMAPLRSLTVIPAAQAISNPAVGNTRIYTISGGTAPYTVYSGNPGVASAGVVGSTLTATVVGVPASDTTVTITIYDSAGVSVTATLILDLSPLRSLTVTPAAQTISAPAVGNTRTYTILGGTGPYSAYSSDPGAATVGVVGSTLTATVAGVPSSDTTVTITVYDSVSASATATLTLKVSPLVSLSVIPAAQAISNPVIANTRTYTILGGTGPYTAYSGNPGLATVGVAGSTLTATVAGVPSVDTTVTMTIYDNVGASTTATLVLDVGAIMPLTVIPAAQVISSPAVANTRTYSILGGTGPYTVYSGNPGLVTVGVAGPLMTATVAGVPAVDTTVTMTIYDSVGASVPATLLLDVGTAIGLTVMPAAQTISAPALGNTAIYSILGGTGPYTAFSDNPGKVTVGVAGPVLTATVAGVPLADTTVTITVYDAVAASKTVTLILDVVSDSLRVIPAAQTIASPVVANTRTYSILGGISPYTAYSENPALVTTGVAGSVLTATVASVPAVDTTVSITIYDSAGSSVAADLVLDVAGATPLAVTPSTVTVTGFANPDANPFDDLTFTITGGVGPYSMYSNNNAIIASQGLLGGSTFFVDPDSVNASLTVTITVEDSLGATDTSTVLVTPTVSSFSLQPSAVTILEGDSVTIYMMGGTGAYETFTSDSAGLCVPAPGGGTLPATPTSFVVSPGVGCNAGSPYTITLVDSIGNLKQTVITVNPTFPVVISTSPVNNVTGVVLDTPVTITWSEPVDCATVNTSNVTISPLPATWTLTSTCVGSSASATFTPTGQAATTIYQVTVGIGITDPAGDAMLSPYIFSYRTAP